MVLYENVMYFFILFTFVNWQHAREVHAGKILREMMAQCDNGYWKTILQIVKIFERKLTL